jgi:hypothetical protein
MSGRLVVDFQGDVGGRGGKAMTVATGGSGVISVQAAAPAC